MAIDEKERPYHSEACTTAPVPVQEEKHVDLYRAIQEAGSIVEVLDRLLDRAGGEGPKQPPEANSGPPTLLQLLDGGAEDLRDKTSAAHDRLNQLSLILFGG